MYKRHRDNTGFTLIEMIIVVLIMGILAALIVPIISSTSEDAKLNTFKSNLSSMRKAIELYCIQHNNTYPGARNPMGGVPASQDQARNGFRCQLCRYTDVNGECSPTKDATHKFGPYKKQLGLPENPYNNLSTILIDMTTTDITARTSDGTTGWKLYTKTGVFIANDGDHDNL